jgi:hypothetical protein
MRSMQTLLLAVLLLVTIPVAGGEGGRGDAPVAREQGFPIPAGARKNTALGGATTLAPGKNYTLVVYDIDSAIDTVNAFYRKHLADAARTEEANEVRFSTRGGTVKLARLDQGTRITLVIGPR